VVAEGEGRWFTVPASLDGDVTPLSPPAVDSGEVIVSLERDGDRLVTGTTFGRLIVSTLDGEPLHTADIGVAGPMASSVLGQHDIVAMGQDGILRSYDGDLHLRRSVMFGAGGFVMRASADGRTLVLALTDFSVWAVDPVSLQVQQAIGVRSEDLRRILPSPDSARVVRVNPARHGTDSSTPATVETVPLRVDR
ncbi:MAG: toll/interleukin receptor protein, partial [Solirubrobacterales bacterium]|nr:toll/interleukin receptor protein [Solirubrobacterales bacterium]